MKRGGILCKRNFVYIRIILKKRISTQYSELFEFPIGDAEILYSESDFISEKNKFKIAYPNTGTPIIKQASIENAFTVTPTCYRKDIKENELISSSPVLIS